MRFLLVVLFLSSFVTGWSQERFAPEWAERAIWYQIFPERFANGDPSNDPTVNELRGADPQELPQVWQVHPWTSDWYELQPYERENGAPELWRHLLRRRYGGDLQGILDRLDYIEALGITAIYLNPVFEAPSLHKYDGATYHHIDPNFGPDPAGDRALMAQEVPHDPSTWVWTQADELGLELIRELHARDIRVIFDGVFNHMGVNSFAWRDVLANQQESVYADWFEVKSWDDPKKGTEFAYDGWWGVKSLPELREDEHGIVRGPKDYIFAATERWMNPKGLGNGFGIDGWRLDVAFCVGHPFWKDWRKWVKQLNPEAYLTAEIVDVPEKVVPYMQGDEFDGEMNYNFAFACVEYFVYEGEKQISAAEFDRKLAELRNMYPDGVAQVSQNLFGSHDTNRMASLIRNRGIGSFRDWGTYFSVSKAIDNPDYSPRKPKQQDYHLLKLMVIFQMTYPGAPMIYYGDEVGMWGANDPDCRKPMVWTDLNYTPERHFPDQTTHSPERVSVNYDLLNHYKTVIGIRRAHRALQDGSYRTLRADNAANTFAFVRENADERLLILLNNAEEDRKITVPADWRTAQSLLLGAVTSDLADQGQVLLPGKWGAILHLEK